MTYNKNQIFKDILLEFLNNKIIKMSVYLEMINNFNNYLLVEDFLIHCIDKFNIPYKYFPIKYKYDENFINLVAEVRPDIIKEAYKSNTADYAKLTKNTNLNKTQSKIRKISVNSSQSAV